jgi:hypothetical protein
MRRGVPLGVTGGGPAALVRASAGVWVRAGEGSGIVQGLTEPRPGGHPVRERSLETLGPQPAVAYPFARKSI